MSVCISLKDTVTALGDIFMPRYCIVCGQPLALHERHLCIRCLADLPMTYFSYQSRNQMADRFNDFIQRDLDADPSLPSEEYVFATSLFFYRSSTGYRKITQRLKYHADFAAGRFFSEMLGEQMTTVDHFKDIDVVIPVPLHWSRRWSRGYNQAEVIAEVLGKALGAKVRKDILLRPGRTRTQTKLSIEEKSRNVSKAFAVRKGYAGRLASGKERQPRHVLLIDDVFTTGATMHACFRALREVFPKGTRISLATLAAVGM